ncbi:hypothetical protein D477_007756 [Arthrobacter crystallopoietes BAB-32]|uniref:DUF4190 domain-containing protein n=1 Tax=Arthrobacter crystallopoietes BAB-32 TaxID=1246476 RepID=N1V0J0_9MICC|nr:DUF4190 domain-containing protein [Arthrobacter crystallopoietes]EMY34795.1 hypothetical protein D477_007756 [Arthrobacter crystallopoietes BAB-32]
MSHQSETPSTNPQGNTPQSEGQTQQPAGQPGSYGRPYGQGTAHASQYAGYPDQAGYGYQQAPKQKSGLAITALVLGIVAIGASFIPFLGMVSFILGPLAVIFGIIALVKKQKKGFSITGIVLGALGAIIAGIITAVMAVAISSVTGEHTVQYKVTADGPATVVYTDGLDPVQEEITGDWEQEITFTGVPVGALTVVSDGNVSCEIIMDGQSAATNSGVGQADCVIEEIQ